MSLLRGWWLQHGNWPPLERHLHPLCTRHLLCDCGGLVQRFLSVMRGGQVLCDIRGYREQCLYQLSSRVLRDWVWFQQRGPVHSLHCWNIRGDGRADSLCFVCRWIVLSSHWSTGMQHLFGWHVLSSHRCLHKWDLLFLPGWLIHSLCRLDILHPVSGRDLLWHSRGVLQRCVCRQPSGILHASGCFCWNTLPCWHVQSHHWSHSQLRLLGSSNWDLHFG
jgi:hypothetical protein